MKLDNVERAAALLNERKKINSFISAFESDSKNTGEFKIKYSDFEHTISLSKVLITDPAIYI
jgi:hypothetical protein